MLNASLLSPTRRANPTQMGESLKERYDHKGFVIVQGLLSDHQLSSLEQASEFYFTYYHVLLRLPYMTQMAEFMGMLILPYKMLLLCSGQMMQGWHAVGLTHVANPLDLKLWVDAILGAADQAW